MINEFADLYWELNAARSVVVQAGLDPRDIRFDHMARLNWFHIVESALQQGRIEALLHEASQVEPDRIDKLRTNLDALEREASPPRIGASDLAEELGSILP